MTLLSKSEFTKRLGANLKSIREDLKISQEELADRSGIYRTYINHIETARYSPGSYIVYKIAKALGISPTDIYPK